MYILLALMMVYAGGPCLGFLGFLLLLYYIRKEC